MKILVAFEESQSVCKAFRAMGYEAYSNDLKACSGGHPEWHLQMDAFEAIEIEEWDMLIAHPVCTALTCSAEWAHKDPDYKKYPKVGYHQKVKSGTLVGAERREARKEAVELVKKLYNCKIPKICIENPVGALTKMFRPPSQYVQPFNFGDPYSKKTGLWLKGLDPLVATNELTVEKDGYLAKNGKYRWMNQTPTGQSNVPPSADRATIRSKTFKGISSAMANQFTKYK